MDVESQALLACKLLQVEWYEVINVIVCQLYVDGLHLFVVGYHLDVCHLCIFLHRNQKIFLALILFADAIDTVTIVQE